MLNPKDVDLFSRTLSADWQSRIEFYRKFILENSRIRRLGSAYRNPEDFLQDTFTNVLRTAHSFQGEENLGDWVESVAAWTGLERQRFRDSEGSVEAPRVRVSAATEGDEPGFRGRLASYAPPLSGPQDTLAARLISLIGESQYAMLSLRSREGTTWEQVAEAGSKPLNTVGPIVARAADRLARFFGAPPPLNDDLEPVFSWRSEKNPAPNGAERTRSRLFAMQTDPSFYSPTPESRKIGLTIPAEVRAITLWDAARSSTPPPPSLRDHLSQCSYCTALLRAMLLVQQALQSGPAASFLVCPGGFTLLNTDPQSYPPFDQHLAECPTCREELHRMSNREEEASRQPGGASRRRMLKIGAAAAVVLVLGAGAYIGLERSRSVPPASVPSSPSEIPLRPMAVDKRFTGLAQPIDVTDKRWLNSVRPQNRDIFAQLITLMRTNRIPLALINASPLADRDPGIEMLYAVGLYEQQSISEGYHAMLKSEAMDPRDPFRCWAMLNCALIVGDLPTVEREADHLAANPDYGKLAKSLLEKARAKSRG